MPADAQILRQRQDSVFQAYNIQGKNYFKLRALAVAMGKTNKPFNVEWDSTKNAIMLTSGVVYTEQPCDTAVKQTDDKEGVFCSSIVYVNGVKAKFRAYTIDGNNYFQLREVMKHFESRVNWIGSSNTISVETDIGTVYYYEDIMDGKVKQGDLVMTIEMEIVRYNSVCSNNLKTLPKYLTCVKASEYSQEDIQVVNHAPARIYQSDSHRRGVQEGDTLSGVVRIQAPVEI